MKSLDSRSALERSARALLATSALCLASPALAQVVLGPVASPSTPSRYYVVQAPNWMAARAQALSMGGDLATIDDANENAFVQANLTNGGLYKLFIGLNDAAIEGAYAWADGSNSAYRNWRPGQPGGNLTNDFVVMQPTDSGRWDVVFANYTQFALVEIRGPIRVPQEIPTLEAALNAMDAAQANEIVLGPGVHTTSGSSIAHTGMSSKITGAGAGVSIVRNSPGDWQPLVWLTGRWDVRGVTFENRSTDTDPAVRLTGSSSTSALRACELIGTGGGWGLEVGGGTNFILERCRLARFQHGVRLNLNTGLTAVNSSISVPFTAISLNRATADVVNCVVLGRIDLDAGGRLSVRNSIVRGDIEGLPGDYSVQYSNISPPVSGTGNIDLAPRFAGPDDFRLLPGSPCIDAGSVSELCRVMPSCTSLTDLDGSSRTIDDPATPDTGVGAPAVDMGCFEHQPAVCGADYNGDSVVDFFDYLDFVAAFDRGC
jgi:hypothetical protein